MKSRQIDFPDGSHTVVEWFGERSDKGLVIFLSALGVDITYYHELGNAWAQLGYLVSNVEMRGRKQSSVHGIKRENFGYNEVLNIDLAAVISSVSGEIASRPLYLENRAFVNCVSPTLTLWYVRG